MTGLLKITVYAALPVVIGLMGCTDNREQALQENVQSEADYPPQLESIVSEPDGELGVPVEVDKDAPMDKPSVLNPPDTAQQDVSDEVNQAFAELDENNDGYIQSEEAQARESLGEQWEQLDSDDDQRLDVAEFARFEAPQADAALQEP